MKYILFYCINILIFLPCILQAELITDKLIKKAEIKYNDKAKNRFTAVRKKLINKLRRKKFYFM